MKLSFACFAFPNNVYIVQFLEKYNFLSYLFLIYYQRPPYYQSVLFLFCRDFHIECVRSRPRVCDAHCVFPDILTDNLESAGAHDKTCPAKKTSKKCEQFKFKWCRRTFLNAFAQIEENLFIYLYVCVYRNLFVYARTKTTKSSHFVCIVLMVFLKMMVAV